MIVYAGKQYGNDFNNGDEGLFQDANRPRDNDKFKLRPGLQSDKWDWRKSNKETQPKIATFAGLGNSVISGISDGTTVTPQGMSIFFQGDPTASDFAPYSSIVTIHKDLNGNYFTPATIAESYANLMDYNNKLTSDAFRISKDGFIECLKTGVYFINISCQLWYSSGHSTTNTYKEYAFMYNTDGTTAKQLDLYSRRSTGDPGNVRWTVAMALGKGEQLLFAMSHTDTSHTAMATYVIALVQIG